MYYREKGTIMEWRNVPGFAGKYQVSIGKKEGQLKNTDYRGTGKVSICPNTINKYNKRIYWHLTFNGVQYSQQAAYWIAITYPELVQNEYFEGAHIDHIDTDRLNNHPSNLRWVTKRENNNNPLTLQHQHDARINRKDLSRPVEQYSLSGNFIKEYPSVAEAGRALGKSHQNITSCCNNKPHYSTAYGYIWRYKD